MQRSTGILKGELPSSSELLNDHELATLAGAIGNNEGKALLLVAMATENSEHTPTSLHRLVTNLPGMDSVHSGGVYTQKSWCQSSIEPAGLVETRASGGTHITSVDLKLGVPLAGLLLDHADTYDVPLVELFGETRSSSEVSSQHIRLRIIEELLTNPGGVQLRNFVKSSDASHQVVVEKQLRKLANAGLITHDDWNVARNQIRYETTTESHSSLAAKSGFVGAIAQHLLEAPQTSHDQIINYCIRTVPGFDQLERNVQSTKVASAMFSLKGQGLVGKIEGRVQPAELNITLSSEQLEQWTDLCNKLESFRAQDPEVLTKWTEVALQFITDSTKVTRAFERYRTSSARANPSEKDLGAIVLHALQETNGPTPIREVVELASTLRGSSVSHFGVVAVLNRLVDEELVDRKQDKVLLYSKR